MKKVRTFYVYSPVTPKSYLEDLSTAFSQFGKVVSCKQSARDNLITLVELKSSQRQAIRCVKELNEVPYKGESLRIRFAEWEEEDGEEFRRSRLVEFRKYPVDSVVPPEIRQKRLEGDGEGTAAAASTSAPEVPIGVLPPSSSLGGFGATDSRALNSLLMTLQQQQAKARQTLAEMGQQQTSEPGPSPSPMPGPAPKKLTSDPYDLKSVEGKVRNIRR